MKRFAGGRTQGRFFGRDARGPRSEQGESVVTSLASHGGGQVVLVHPAGAVPEALAEAAAYLQQAGRGEQVTLLVFGALGRDDDLWHQLSPVLDDCKARSVPEIVLGLPGGAARDPDGYCPARVISDRWGVPVVAALGGIAAVPGGSLFAPEDTPAGGGWWRFTPGLPAKPLGLRHPVPWWGPELTRIGIGNADGHVVEAIPAGLLVRPPAASAEGINAIRYSLPVDDHRLTVLVGVRDAPAVTAESVVTVLAALPARLRAATRLAPGDGGDLLPLAEEVADLLGAPVEVVSGLPLLTERAVTEGESYIRFVLTGGDGNPSWMPWIESVICHPREGAARPTADVARLRAPVAGLVPTPEPGVLVLEGRWRLVLTRAGMWIGSRTGERQAATARSINPDVVSIDLGAPGLPLDPELLDAMDRLLAELDDAARQRVVLQVFGACPDEQFRELRRLAVRHGVSLAPRAWAVTGGTGVPGVAGDVPAARPAETEASTAQAVAVAPRLALTGAGSLTPSAPAALSGAAAAAPAEGTRPALAPLVIATPPELNLALVHSSSVQRGSVEPAAVPMLFEAATVPAALSLATSSTTSTVDPLLGPVGAPTQAVAGAGAGAASHGVGSAPSRTAERDPAPVRVSPWGTGPAEIDPGGGPTGTDPVASTPAARPGAAAGSVPDAPAAAVGAGPERDAGTGPSAAAELRAEEHPAEQPAAARRPVVEDTFLPLALNSTDADRAVLRSVLAENWERHSAEVMRALTRIPALRARELQDDVRADLIAVVSHLSDAQAPLSRARLRAQLALEPQQARPLLAGLASGLRRLPSHRGVVLRGLGPARADAGLQPGDELFDSLPVSTLDSAWRLAGDRYLIWSVTGRRARSLVDGPAGYPYQEIVFTPQTRFRVLEATVTGGRTTVLLRELAESAEFSPRGSLDEQDEMCRDKLRAALAGAEAASSGGEWLDRSVGALIRRSR